jgi:nucleoside-diphosphate-sugar epimerase
MSRILVTGETGFIGRALVPALILAGHQVRCAVLRKVDGFDAEQLIINKLELQTDWSEALHGIDVVIHLAARVHIMEDKSASSLDEYCKVNSVATKNLAEQAAQSQVKRFIFLSSIKVNGEFTLAGTPFTENSISQPEDSYGKSKWYAEQSLQEIAQTTKMQIVILRPPLIYGPGVKANFLKMLRWVEKGLPLPFGRIDNRRSFVFIDNLISAICCVLTAPQAANQTYLIADDESLSLPHLMNLIAREMRVKIRLLPVPVRLLTVAFKGLGLNNLNKRLFRSLEVSNNKIKSELGWVPLISLAEGLEKTVEWYRYEHNS